MVACSGIRIDGISKSKASPCRICRLRVRAISVLCVQCDWWIHSGVQRYVIRLKQLVGLHV